MTSQNKWCFVPLCKNTSVSTPDKVFLCVPKDHSRKLKWFTAAKRDMPKSQSVFFCCEDHFDLKEDMENYIRFKFIGGNIKLKPGVVPHIFRSQTDKKRAASDSSSAFVKRRSMLMVNEAFAELSSTIKKPTEPEVERREHREQFTQTEAFKGLLEIGDVKVLSTSVQTVTLHCKSVGVQVRSYYRSKYTQYQCKSNVTHIASLPETEYL